MPETKAERYARWLIWYTKNKKSAIQNVMKWRKKHPSAVRSYQLKYSRGSKYKAMRERNKENLERLRRLRITPEYVTWINMKQRCYNKKIPYYSNYGGRGIKVCARWRNSFKTFLADMGRKPSPKHSIDRFPDNNGNYSPSNCRWATAKEQAANKRRS